MRRFFPLVMLQALAACAPGTIALRTTASLLERGSPALYEESDPVLAREALPSQLKLIEALLKNEPGNARLLRLASQGFGGYAFLFLEDEQPERARALYLRARGYGLALASRNASLKGIGSMPLSDLEAALRSASLPDVPGLFWSAYNWAGWINLSKDVPEAVAGLPKAAAMMRRVQELSPGYYHGGPDLFLGTYYAALPRMLGGDPGKSKTHFEAAIEAGRGRFLIAKVLYARYYAVAVQDRELFRKLNGEVAAASEDAPELRLANAVAKLKAKRLLEKTNDLF